MSSTHLDVKNNSDVTIIAKLTWGYSPVSSRTISPGSTGQLGCEFVWYDLTILNEKTNGELLYKSGVYGNDDWTFM